MDDLTLFVRKCYKESFQKQYFAQKTNNTDDILFFSGQVTFLEQNFGSYLGLDVDKENLKNLAKEEVDSLLDFYNSP
jgi:hypothetical protein